RAGRARPVGRRQRRAPGRPDPRGRRSDARQAARGISERARRRGGRAGAAGRRQAEVVAAGDVTPPPTRIALVDPRRPEAPVLEEAAAVLRGGGLVAFPTETFYGPGAPAPDRAAVARGLVEALGAPVTAPSANASGGRPPTTAADVLAYFRDRIELVLDGGPTRGREPSTVLDTTVEPPRVVRQGAVRP